MRKSVKLMELNMERKEYINMNLKAEKKIVVESYFGILLGGKSYIISV